MGNVSFGNLYQARHPFRKVLVEGFLKHPVCTKINTMYMISTLKNWKLSKIKEINISTGWLTTTDRVSHPPVSSGLPGTT